MIAITIPNSTCQYKILNGKGIVIPVFTLKTNNNPNILDIKNEIVKSIFQNFLCLITSNLPFFT